MHDLYIHVHAFACTFHTFSFFCIKAFWLMLAWPPSGPTTVEILVVDYISELTIHSLYPYPFYVTEMYNTSFIVNLIGQIVHCWYKRMIQKLYYSRIKSKLIKFHI